jgi:hypothetical protein
MSLTSISGYPWTGNSVSTGTLYESTSTKKENCLSIRLDVVKGNIPAEKLYLKCGFQYIDTVSLGYEEFGLPWYDLYEKKL